MRLPARTRREFHWQRAPPARWTSGGRTSRARDRRTLDNREPVRAEGAVPLNSGIVCSCSFVTTSPGQVPALKNLVLRVVARFRVLEELGPQS